MPTLEPLAVPLGPASLTVLPRLAEAMAGDAPVLPYAASAPLPASRRFQPGDRLRLGVPPDRLHLFDLRTGAAIR